MTGRLNFWELAGAGAAIGGTGVWALALAARVGLLRGLLELFPRVTWHGLTWVLIPALMLIPSVLQGVGVALASDVRPAPVRLAIGGAVGGTVLASVILALGFVLARIPFQWIVGLIPILPEFVVVCWAIIVVAGWLILAWRVSGVAWIRLMALPLALAAVMIAWAGVHAKAASIVDVIDQHEITGLFAAVVMGGAAGATWIVSLPRETRPRLRPIRGELR